VDAKLELSITPSDAIQRFLLAPAAGFAAMRNLRRNTIAQEHAWIRSWRCADSSSALRDETCVALARQWQVYQEEQAAAPGWEQSTVVIEGALLLLDLRSVATQCLLCNWHQEYARFSERDQLSFSYILHVQRPVASVHLIPRRLHWSVAVEDDTLRCYNATAADARELARRFQHSRRPATAAAAGMAASRMAPRASRAAWPVRTSPSSP